MTTRHSEDLGSFFVRRQVVGGVAEHGVMSTGWKFWEFVEISLNSAKYRRIVGNGPSCRIRTQSRPNSACYRYDLSKRAWIKCGHLLVQGTLNVKTCCRKPSVSVPWPMILVVSRSGPSTPVSITGSKRSANGWWPRRLRKMKNLPRAAGEKNVQKHCPHETTPALSALKTSLIRLKLVSLKILILSSRPTYKGSVDCSLQKIDVEGVRRTSPLSTQRRCYQQRPCGS